MTTTHGCTPKGYRAYMRIRIILYITLAILLIILAINKIKEIRDGSDGKDASTKAASLSPTMKSGAAYFEMEMEVTAYCSCFRCCGQFADGVTASGVGVSDFYGLLIAAPPIYPFGTIMDVPGYGAATVQDRGGVIKGNKIDLLFSTHQEALEWGRRMLIVKVMKPVI